MKNTLNGFWIGMLLLGFLATDHALGKEGNFPTILIMVRHAERDEGVDPPLHKTGIHRAQHLADALDQSGITQILYPAFQRNRQTAEPLAQRIGIKPVEFPVELSNKSKEFAADLIAQLRTIYTGQTVLFIGNQSSPGSTGLGNLQEIYWQLGGKDSPLTRYGDLYVFIIPESGPAQIIHSYYGNL